MVQETAVTSPEEITKPYSEWRRFRRVMTSRGIIIVSMVILAILAITAIFAPLLAPYDPNDTQLKAVLSGPSLKHWLGTDNLGRDILSRIIYGSRTSLMVAAIALGVASSIGMTLGVIAGFFGGNVYTGIMRLIDAVMAFPMILAALFFTTLMGGGTIATMVAVGFSLTPYYARLMCGQVLVVKESDYIKAQKVIGSPSWRTILRHVVPNCFPSLIVLITMQVGLAILAEAGLSFLGLGVQAPTAAWGRMVRDGYRYLTTDPVITFAPGIVIMLVAFAFNMVGDGLRDALDPRLRGSL
jgi:peptide/nickel transport system permease protein